MVNDVKIYVYFIAFFIIKHFLNFPRRVLFYTTLPLSPIVGQTAIFKSMSWITITQGTKAE